MDNIFGKNSSAPSGLRGVRQAEDIVHHICGRKLGFVVQMTVDVRRGADVAVSEPLLNLLHGHVVGQQQRGAAVPEIVEVANKAILVGAENEICYNADRLRFAVACFCMEGRIIHGTKEP